MSKGTKGKSNQQLEVENANLHFQLEALKKGHIYSGVTSVLQALIRWGAIGWCCYMLYLSVFALAGRTTVADISADINLPADQIFDAVRDGTETAATTVFLEYLGGKPGVLISWAAAIIGVLYGRYQRNLRKTTVERLQRRITNLESGRDAGRTSSGITPRGNTHPEDE